MDSALWSEKHILKCQFCNDSSWTKTDLFYFIWLHNEIRNSGLPNFQGKRIPIKSKLNIAFWREILRDYDDYQVCDMLEYGWPVGHIGVPFESSFCRNHKGATDFPLISSNIYKRKADIKQ